MSAMLRRIGSLVFWGAGVVVAVLSLLPQDALPHVDVWDKIEHAGAYAVLALLGARAYPHRALQLGAGLCALGVALEIGQLFVPGRTCTLGDAVANGLGVAVGLGLAAVGARLWRAAADAR